MSSNVLKLENIVGHRFKDIKILERAVTHRSWAFENLKESKSDPVRMIQNETLEFLGDSVLGLVVAEHLLNANPSADEGDLTLMKHNLVSTETLAEIAAELKIGDFLRIGRGEEKTGGRKKQAMLANTLEAVIGAVFFDSGYPAARVFIGRIFTQQFRSVTAKSSLDQKTLLQEILQSAKRLAPTYKVIRTEGPPHDRKFYVEVTWDNGKAQGEGSSIKAAEMMSAAKAIEQIDIELKA